MSVLLCSRTLTDSPPGFPASNLATNAKEMGKIKLFPTTEYATQRHLGHALGGKAGNEAVAQVAHAADVDVAHRVVVGAREDGEEVEVLRGSLHGVVRVLQAAQLHLRLQEAVLLPSRADGGHVLPRVGQQVDLGARVVVPEGHERAHEFREGARHGDVVLRHAVRDAGLLRVHRGVAEHQGPS